MISPRPLTRPGRFDSVISPLTYEPAGTITFPFSMTGNRVSKYTGSPTLAVRVDSPLCRTSGRCVPMGNSSLARAEGGIVATAVLATGAGVASTGLADGAAESGAGEAGGTGAGAGVDGAAGGCVGPSCCAWA